MLATSRRVCGSAAPPKGPVEVSFGGIKVVKADFDPAKVEGGTATLEISIASISSGIAKRDGHLQSPDYFDAAKFPTATIEIGNVKKAAAGYTADAKLKIRDKELTVPATFEVVETMADGIRIKGAASFSRVDAGVGKAEGDSAKPEVAVALQLTLKKR